MVKYLFFITLLFNSICSTGQVNDRIKEKSDENTANRNQSKSDYNNSYDSESEDDEFDAEAYAACFEGCFYGLGYIINGLHEANLRIKEREIEIHRINSADISFPIGYVTGNSTTIIPRVKLHGGLFSTDLRVFSNIEKRGNNNNAYTTVDWQLLMFNIAVEQEANIRIGTGFMMETYSSNIFNEHTFCMDFHMSPRFKWNLEGRFTPDYKTKIMVRQEFNTCIAHTFHQDNQITYSGFVKFLRANYYEEVKFNAIYMGINLNID